MAPTRTTTVRAVVVVLGAALVLGVAACAGDDDGSSSPPSSATPTTAASTTGSGAGVPTSASVPPPGPVLFSPEGNNLWAYDPVPGESDPPQFASQEVVTNATDDPAGWDVNGQVCTLPDGRIVAGEDTGQPDPPAGWGVFAVSGTGVGDLAVERQARLVPAFAPDDEEPDTYGCGVLADGRVVTTVIGNNALGPADGQVVLWFPPFDRTETGATAFCVLDAAVATAQQVWIGPDDAVYVASARPPTSGVWRYDPPFPTGPTATDSCGGTSPGGAPMAGDVARTLVVAPGEDNGLVSPNGVVGTPDGHLYVSSIINGVIAEVDGDGAFVRTVLSPPAGEALGAEPYSTGTPLGLALGDDGTLYYADLGLVVGTDGAPGPAPGRGSVRRIPFVGGDPRPPEVVAAGLTFPDGLGWWTAAPPPG